MGRTPLPPASGPRKVSPIESLNPYFGGWTLRVRAQQVGQLRSVKTARGEQKVFSLELTDEQARVGGLPLRGA